MTKKINPTTAYAFTRDDKEFVVILDRLKNNRNGVARYEATIVPMGKITGFGHMCARYRFTGHLDTECNEAATILERHLENEKKN